MLNFVLGSIVSVISILIGFAMGKGSSIIPEETRKQVKRLIQSLPIRRDIGAVSAPTAHQVENYNNPILREEEEEMTKTFGEIIK